MGVGEYVSVSQQADMEKADVAAEAAAQAAGPESRAEEFEELVQIHIDRGLPEDLARKVAQVNVFTVPHPPSLPFLLRFVIALRFTRAEPCPLAPEFFSGRADMLGSSGSAQV